MRPFSFPFRIGTTSYIIPDDILPNVRFLADKVQDIELVLFQVEDASNLPTAEQINELNRLANQNELTYTIHLPLDLKLGKDGSDQDISIQKGQKVIESTRALHPAAYVVHLDGKWLLPDFTQKDHETWIRQAVSALEIIAPKAGGLTEMAVENLEGYPLEFNKAVFDMLPVSCCIDIGHLWLDGHSAIPFLTKWISRTRVIHLHGIGERAHQSLKYIPAEKLDEVLLFLVDKQYKGILTLELFGLDDFQSSMDVLYQSATRIKGL